MEREIRSKILIPFSFRLEKSCQRCNICSLKLKILNYSRGIKCLPGLESICFNIFDCWLLFCKVMTMNTLLSSCPFQIINSWWRLLLYTRAEADWPSFQGSVDCQIASNSNNFTLIKLVLVWSFFLLSMHYYNFILQKWK